MLTDIGISIYLILCGLSLLMLYLFKNKPFQLMSELSTAEVLCGIGIYKYLSFVDRVGINWNFTYKTAIYGIYTLLPIVFSLIALKIYYMFIKS